MYTMYATRIVLNASSVQHTHIVKFNHRVANVYNVYKPCNVYY